MYRHHRSKEIPQTEILRHDAPPQVCGQTSMTRKAREELWLQIFAAYQIQFSCVHVGKYTSKTKRKISWHFGLTDLVSLRKGKVGSNCTGEETKVQLIWSILSGKIKVLWNDRDITDIFPKVDLKNCILSCGSGLVVELKWMLSSGRTFEIRAHSVAPPGANQYDLLIDGRSFFNLPVISQLGTKEYALAAKESFVGCEEKDRSSADINAIKVEYSSSDGDDTDTNSDEYATNLPNQLGYSKIEKTECKGKLSMSRSMDYHQSSPMSLRVIPSNHQDEIEVVRDYLCANDTHTLTNSVFPDFPKDELQSKSYKRAKLETLRNDVTALIPCMESIMSRAIIAAFSEEREETRNSNKTRTNNDDVLSDDSIKAEAHALWETFKWLKMNDGIKHSAHFHEKKMAFIQKRVNILVTKVRYKSLYPSAVTRIIHSIAAMLELELAIPLPKDTVALVGMRRSVTSEHIANALKEFGEIKAVGVSRGHHGFGICRYRSSSATRRAVDASRRNELMIQDVYPGIFEPSLPLHIEQLDMHTHDTFATEKSVEVIPVNQQYSKKGKEKKEDRHNHKNKKFVISTSSGSDSSTLSFDRKMGSHMSDFDTQISPTGIEDFYRYTQQSFDEGDLSVISVTEIDDGTSTTMSSDAKYSVTISTTSTSISTVLEDSFD